VKKDERLDRVDWLMDKGRFDDAERLLNRVYGELVATGIGQKLMSRIPEQRQRLTKGRNRLPLGSDERIDWSHIDREAWHRVCELTTEGCDPAAVKNLVTDDLAAVHEIFEQADRSRLYAKVVGHVERLQRRAEEVA
jgi:hypothetical protein